MSSDRPRSWSASRRRTTRGTRGGATEERLSRSSELPSKYFDDHGPTGELSRASQGIRSPRTGHEQDSSHLEREAPVFRALVGGHGHHRRRFPRDRLELERNGHHLEQ